MQAADANDDDQINIGDPVLILGGLFSGGPAPSAPYPSCGPDPTPGALTCESFPPCCPAPPPPALYPGLTFLGTSNTFMGPVEEYTVDVTHSDPAKRVVLILIPGGTFMMGASGISGCDLPIHPVTLSPYFIAKTEITNEQYRYFCDTAGGPGPGPNGYPPTSLCCGMPSDHFTNPAYDNHPVVMVSWNDLKAPNGYLAWAGLSLPTEAQWEYAARGIDQRTYPWGNDVPNAGNGFCNGCWGYNCTGTDGWVYTSPVAQSPFDQYPGPFGTLG